MTSPTASTPVRLSATGFAIEGAAPPQRLLAFIDAVCRGIGQVMLQNNSYTGLLFLTGIFYNSVLMGWAVLVGTAASTVTATLLGADRTQVRAGIFGFNGALVGIALLTFLEPGPLAWGYVVLGAACSTVVMAALTQAMSTWKVPALTAPFVLTTLCFVLAYARFAHLGSASTLPTAGLPTSPSFAGTVSGATIAEGLFTGVAQVFLQGNAITGAFFVAALLINSRAAGFEALLGSFVGLLVAWALGAAEPAIRGGLFGFNSVLTAIALGSAFFDRSPASTIYTLLGVVATVVVFAAMSAALQPLGLPALTAPFVLVTWVFIFAGPHFPRVRRKPA